MDHKANRQSLVVTLRHPWSHQASRSNMERDFRILEHSEWGLENIPIHVGTDTTNQPSTFYVHQNMLNAASALYRSQSNLGDLCQVGPGLFRDVVDHLYQRSSQGSAKTNDGQALHSYQLFELATRLGMPLLQSQAFSAFKACFPATKRGSDYQDPQVLPSADLVALLSNSQEAGSACLSFLTDHVFWLFCEAPETLYGFQELFHGNGNFSTSLMHRIFSCKLILIAGHTGIDESGWIRSGLE